MRLLAILVVLASLVATGARAEPPVLRIAVLRFGTANWLTETIVAHHLDEAAGYRLDVIELAGRAATNIAFQSGDVDVIIADWEWALQQRNRGADLRFAPYSNALGAIMAKPAVEGICDLKGRPIGVVGGDRDKSWLVLQALVRRDCGFDLADETTTLVGAAPLMGQQLLGGAVDAVSTYWNHAAELEAAGMHRLIGVDEELARLGITPAPPLIGFVWHAGRVEQERVGRFLQSVAAAQDILAKDDAEWERLAPRHGGGERCRVPAAARLFPGRDRARLDARGHGGRRQAARPAGADGGRGLRRRGGQVRPGALRAAAEMRAGTRALWPALSLAGFVALWAVVAAAIHSAKLPTPVEVGEAAVRQVVTNDYFFHLGITLARVAASFFIAMAVGSAIGLALGASQAANRAFGGWLTLFLNLPALVTIILCYVWFGLVETAAIAAVAINKIPNVAVTVREGTRALSRDLAEMAQVYELPWGARMRHVVLPQLAPFFAVAARNGLALVWKIVLVVELLGRPNGVGYQLYVYFQQFDVATILAYAFGFILVVQAIETLVLEPWERSAARWRR